MDKTLIDSHVRVRKALDQAFGVYEHEEAKRLALDSKKELEELCKT